MSDPLYTFEDGPATYDESWVKLPYTPVSAECKELRICVGGNNTLRIAAYVPNHETRTLKFDRYVE